MKNRSREKQRCHNLNFEDLVGRAAISPTLAQAESIVRRWNKLKRKHLIRTKTPALLLRDILSIYRRGFRDGYETGGLR